MTIIQCVDEPVSRQDVSRCDVRRPIRQLSQLLDCTSQLLQRLRRLLAPVAKLELVLLGLLRRPVPQAQLLYELLIGDSPNAVEQILSRTNETAPKMRQLVVSTPPVICGSVLKLIQERLHCGGAVETAGPDPVLPLA